MPKVKTLTHITKNGEKKVLLNIEHALLNFRKICRGISPSYTIQFCKTGQIDILLSYIKTASDVSIQ